MTVEQLAEILKEQIELAPNDFCTMKKKRTKNEAYYGLQIINKYVDQETVIITDHFAITSVFAEELVKAGLKEDDAGLLGKFNWEIHPRGRMIHSVKG